MALRKATFTITTDTLGYGEDDVRFRPNSSTRPAVLRAVEVTESPGGGTLTLYELPYDDVELEYDFGTQLFTTTNFDSMDHPRTTTVDEAGVAISGAENGDIYIDERHVRATIDDGVPSSDYTVVVTYETAGDYRF